MRSGLGGEVRSLGALGKSSQGEMWKVNEREGDGEEERNPLAGVFRGSLPFWGITRACRLDEVVSGARSPTHQRSHCYPRTAATAGFSKSNGAALFKIPRRSVNPEEF